ncbi:MAG: Uma2 family endonuclease [Polyangiaceae bacterium]|nr:Uma2 family endonuclease [Polyangiaceae bacterium]
MGHPAQAVPTFEALYEQIRALPEQMTGEILEPGILRTRSRPGRPHRTTQLAIVRSLDGFNRTLGSASWWIEVEAEIRFPLSRLLVPALSGFRVERVPDLPDENPIPILPDWCCEILSPTTDREDRTVKLPLFAKSGVPWSWIVDPVRHTVEVFETIDGRPALTAVAREEERAMLPPFGDLDISHFWLHRAEPAGP